MLVLPLLLCARFWTVPSALLPRSDPRLDAERERALLMPVCARKTTRRTITLLLVHSLAVPNGNGSLRVMARMFMGHGNPPATNYITWNTRSPTNGHACRAH